MYTDDDSGPHLARGRVDAVTRPTQAHARRRVRAPDVLTEAWAAIARALKLSSRESQMVRLACYDESVVTMASRMGLSEHTIHTYLVFSP